MTTTPLRGGPGIERFLSFVDKDAPGGCWLWLSASSGRYGLMWLNGGNVLAHRFAYEHFIGPIPAAYQIDHLCRVTHCVNPAHLEAVTPRENTLRYQAVSKPRPRDVFGRFM